MWDLRVLPQPGKMQEAARGCGMDALGPFHPRSPLPGEGARAKLLIQRNFGSDFKRFLVLAGKSFERGLCSWSFSCLIKSGIHSNSIAGNAWGKFTASTAGSDPALQGNEISHQTYPEKPKFGILNSRRGKFFKRARVFYLSFPVLYTRLKLLNLGKNKKVCIFFSVFFPECIYANLLFPVCCFIVTGIYLYKTREKMPNCIDSEFVSAYSATPAYT